MQLRGIQTGIIALTISSTAFAQMPNTLEDILMNSVQESEFEVSQEILEIERRNKEYLTKIILPRIRKREYQIKARGASEKDRNIFETDRMNSPATTDPPELKYTARMNGILQEVHNKNYDVIKRRIRQMAADIEDDPAIKTTFLTRMVKRFSYEREEYIPERRKAITIQEAYTETNNVPAAYIQIKGRSVKVKEGYTTTREHPAVCKIITVPEHIATVKITPYSGEREIIKTRPVRKDDIVSP